MKRAWFLMLLTVLLCSCAPAAKEMTTCFSGGFSCEMRGESRGVYFAARCEASPVNGGGVLPLTVTFYAPEPLAGTWICRDKEGTLTFGVGELSLSEMPEGMADILALFPVLAGVNRVTVSKNGHTLAECGDVTVGFGADGVPLWLARGEICAELIDWQTGAKNEDV